MRTARRWLLENAKGWRDPDDGQHIDVVKVDDEAMYPLATVWPKCGTMGADDYESFLGAFDLRGTEILRLLEARDAQHAVLHTAALARAREEADKEIAHLKRVLGFQRDNNHERNLELDALHYVWCDGGCRGGTHRFTPGEVTEEVVALAERNTKRLRTWWINKQARDARAATPATKGPETGGDR